VTAAASDDVLRGAFTTDCGKLLRSESVLCNSLPYGFKSDDGKLLRRGDFAFRVPVTSHICSSDNRERWRLLDVDTAAGLTWHDDLMLLLMAGVSRGGCTSLTSKLLNSSADWANEKLTAFLLLLFARWDGVSCCCILLTLKPTVSLKDQLLQLILAVPDGISCASILLAPKLPVSLSDQSPRLWSGSFLSSKKLSPQTGSDLTVDDEFLLLVTDEAAVGGVILLAEIGVMRGTVRPASVTTAFAEEALLLRSRSSFSVFLQQCNTTQ